MSKQEAIREFLLAFADDEHLMGQQHTEWIGVAPFLEEDLAFSSIGQDELGHAAMLYELVLELDGIEPTDTAVDTLAFGRPSHDYRCCHLVEHETKDWAEALVRHWVYDAFEAMRWHLVAGSSMPKLAAIARKALREEVFHTRHADALLDRLLAAPEARSRLLAALDAVVPMVPGLCEGTAGEAVAVAEGAAAGPTAGLLEPLLVAIDQRFSAAGLDGRSAGSAGVGGPSAGGAANGQRGRTSRSPDFEPLMARMREVLDYDSEAVW
ncbi:MAG: phenylacetate-CoA oxygenase subunit PaaC [Acidimicrobiaceae bacterium]|nr:phenylacetate-CoA oxygenase subunit PaaC [Acidimicrobiaceae bacterium]MYK76598.1 phenylacetate-CoA oxygenase subunit PaaC [Acidimicrobiaceae bacterium]